eukprot:TRINITY_DN9091_c0_g1_i1.p1 TRINITY_DN9091_c0_g1~~TRINITY_DN9091_c0_g1_i1.p1  ORF type:complete len:218 (-),score=59.31 TRINITY_DN9091_c0_g1_i1:67-720(-)
MSNDDNLPELVDPIQTQTYHPPMDFTIKRRSNIKPVLYFLLPCLLINFFIILLSVTGSISEIPSYVYILFLIFGGLNYYFINLIRKTPFSISVFSFQNLILIGYEQIPVFSRVRERFTLGDLKDVYFQMSKLGDSSQVGSTVGFLVLEMKGRSDLVKIKMVQTQGFLSMFDGCFNFEGKFDQKIAQEEKILQMLHYRNKDAIPKALRFVEGTDGLLI